jgi:hypothetical protein
MDEKTKNWCLHIDTREWFNGAGLTDPWLTIYRDGELSDRKEVRFIWSFLIKKKSITKELSTYTFDQFDGYPVTETFENNGKIKYYSRFGKDDREPLFFRRRFVGKESYLEISQEFIHFFQLYHDQPNSKYQLILPDGSEESVIEIIGNHEIRILTRRVKQFLAFKNLSLMFCVVFQRFFSEPIGEEFTPTNLKQVMVQKSKKSHYAIWYQDYQGKSRYFTEFIGKKEISAIPIEKSGIYPFSEEEQYEDFIIGQDHNGQPVNYNCNPAGLSDFYGKNPGKPIYVTPVFFKKDVLVKYYNDPKKFKVEDGYIEIGDYSLRADTNHPDHISVYLGDLGRDIPYSEQRYWRAFNILPDGRISETAFRRDFLGQFADPQAEHYRFRYKYNSLNEAWENLFGWPLFKPLNPEDHYRFDNLRIPVVDTQQEFDTQLEALAIILIDSINKSDIDKVIENQNTKIRQIQSLELFCEKKGIKDYKKHIDYLHSLYRLRSQGASHRKDNHDYPKIRTEFRLDELGYIKAFREILVNIIDFLDFFIEYTDTIPR